MKKSGMKKFGMSFGQLSMLVGVILCLIKAGGGLATCPWWGVTSPIWVPIVLFALFMLAISGIVGARVASDEIAEEVFESPRPTPTPRCDGNCKFPTERSR